jgi:hypothetical protein
MCVGLGVHQRNTLGGTLHSKRDRGDCKGYVAVGKPDSKPVARFLLMSAHRESREWRIWLERWGALQAEYGTTDCRK